MKNDLFNLNIYFICFIHTVIKSMYKYSMIQKIQKKIYQNTK